MIEFTNIIDVKRQCTRDMNDADRSIKILQRKIKFLEKYVISDFVMSNPKRYDKIYDKLQKKRRDLIDAQKTFEWSLDILVKIEFLKKVVIYYDSDVERLPISIRLRVCPDSTDLYLEYIDDANYGSLPMFIKYMSYYNKESFHGLIVRHYNDTSDWVTCGIQEFVRILETENNDFMCYQFKNKEEGDNDVKSE